MLRRTHSRRDAMAAEQRGDNGEVLVLDERYLPLGTARAGVVVAVEAGSDADGGLFDRLQFGARRGAEADPDDAADLRQRGARLGDDFHRSFGRRGNRGVRWSVSRT